MRVGFTSSDCEKWLIWVPTAEVNSPFQKHLSHLNLPQTNISVQIVGAGVTQDSHQLCHSGIPGRDFGGRRKPSEVVHVSATHGLQQAWRKLLTRQLGAPAPQWTLEWGRGNKIFDSAGGTRGVNHDSGTWGFHLTPSFLFSFYPCLKKAQGKAGGQQLKLSPGQGQRDKQTGVCPKLPDPT